MRAHLKNLALVGLAVSAAACAGDAGRYPSLALRSFETGETTAPAPPAPAPIRTPEQDAALAALIRRADAAHADFVSQQARTEPLARAARGLPVESDVRARALVAMADLASKRGATSAVLADLDALAVGDATRLESDPAVEAARTRIAALVASEDAGIAQLWEAMGS
jgi:hypothetical protein